MYDFDDKVTAYWLQSGIGPREAAAKLQPACDGTPLSEEKLCELEDQWREKRNANNIFGAILCRPWNRLRGFDLEDVSSPADHAHVVRALAEATGNRFTVDDVAQTTEPNDDVKLTFTHNGKSYSFAFENHGTWCNIKGVLQGLNRILAQVGLGERFVELDVGSDVGSIVAFVRPTEFQIAARELGVPVQPLQS